METITRKGDPLVQLDLSSVDEATLLDEDAAVLNRLAYTTSLIRLNKFLRRTPSAFAEEESQAKVAVAYIKNIEATRLGALQIGRTASDLHLRDEVARMRSELTQVANYRAEAMTRKRKARDGGAA